MKKEQIYQTPKVGVYEVSPRASVLLDTSAKGVTSTKWETEESACDNWD